MRLPSHSSSVVSLPTLVMRLFTEDKDDGSGPRPAALSTCSPSSLCSNRPNRRRNGTEDVLSSVFIRCLPLYVCPARSQGGLGVPNKRWVRGQVLKCRVVTCINHLPTRTRACALREVNEEGGRTPGLRSLLVCFGHCHPHKGKLLMAR